jgi:YD repeat-containing protein
MARKPMNKGKQLRIFLATAFFVIISLLPFIRAEGGSVSYVYDELNRLIQAIYDDGTIITYTYDKVGNRLVKDISFLQEAVSPPSKPTGPTGGTAEVLYSYSSAGSSSDLGHPVQYLFDWGDGTNSGWLPAGQTSASKFWPLAGPYEVKVKARCANHNFIVSDWSEGLPVNIVPIQIALQSPLDNAAFNSCSLIAKYQSSFTWTANWTFAQYTIRFSISPTDFATQGVLITKVALSGTSSSWTPTISLWKTIMIRSNNKGNIRDIYWKVIGTRADKKTVESEVRSFRIGDRQEVMIDAPADGAILPSDTLPTFNFNSSCNVKFRLEFSPMETFSVPTKIEAYIFTISNPNVETSLQKTLTKLQWNAVRTLVGKKTGYFRIKAHDGINRETISEVRSFTIQ